MTTCLTLKEGYDADPQDLLVRLIVSRVTPNMILVIRTSSIGDVVLATACLKLLADAGLSCKTIWLGRAPSLALIERSYPEVKVIDSDQSSYFEQLKKYRISHVIDLQTNFRSFLIRHKLRGLQGSQIVKARKQPLTRWLAVIRGRIWGRRIAREYNLSDSVLQYSRMVDAVVRGLNKEVAGASAVRATPYLNMARFPRIFWANSNANRAWIALAPGALHGPKQTPLALWQQVFRALHLTHGHKFGILLIGSEQEQDLAIETARTLSFLDNIVDMTGKWDLCQSASALSLVQVALTNDSALAHLAEAVGTPCAMVMGPTHEIFGFRPWRPESRAFSSSLGCRPCSKHGMTPCRYGDYKCFAEIDTHSIYVYLSQIIDRFGREYSQEKSQPPFFGDE